MREMVTAIEYNALRGRIITAVGRISRRRNPPAEFMVETP